MKTISILRSNLVIIGMLTLTRCTDLNVLGQPENPPGPPEGRQRGPEHFEMRGMPMPAGGGGQAMCPCCQGMMMGHDGNRPMPPRVEPGAEEGGRGRRGPVLGQAWNGGRAPFFRGNRPGGWGGPPDLQQRMAGGPPGMPGPRGGMGGGMGGMGGMGAGLGMPGMMGGMGPGPGMGMGRGPDDERMAHLHEAIQHLHAAGLHEVADKLAQLAKDKEGKKEVKKTEIKEGKMEGEKRSDSMIEERMKKFGDQIAKLQQQVEKLRRGMEMRDGEEKGEKKGKAEMKEDEYKGKGKKDGKEE